MFIDEIVKKLEQDIANYGFVYKTVIPKKPHIRSGFFESFYFDIIKETDSEYWLQMDSAKIIKNFESGNVLRTKDNVISEKLNSFHLYLNYTLDQGDWIPFIKYSINLQTTLIGEDVLIFTKYNAPSPYFYYGTYTLTAESWKERLQNYGSVFTDDYDTMMAKISAHPWFVKKL